MKHILVLIPGITLCFFILACNRVLEADKTELPVTAEVVSTDATTEPVAMKRLAPSYLEEIIPPCIPVAGSEQDPCMPSLPPIVETASSAGHLLGWLYFDMPSFTEMLLGEFDDEYYPLWAPHIVVRGTVLPKTTRCELYPIRSFDLRGWGFFEDWDEYHCFANIRISEYIVGEGPPELTVSLHQESMPLGDRRDDWSNIKDKIIMNDLNDPQTRTAETYEGRELVMLLQPNTSISIETWMLGWQFSTWFIQRVGDEVRAVASDITDAITDEQRARLDLPLAELVEGLKQAAEERATITGGRIGVSLSLPMFITDANKLEDYYQVTGTKYYSSGGTTVLPPPVPGEGQDTTTTTEAIVTAPTTTEAKTPVITYALHGQPSWLYDGIPTFTDILLGQGATSAVPHLVVRGIAQPGSTRCDIYPIIVPNYVFANAEYLFDDLYHYHCFIDIHITEYIVGDGPATVTVSLHRESLYLGRLADWPNQKDEQLDFWNDPASSTASTFEGKEMILFLGLPGTLGVEAWVSREPFNLWFIEQTPEGELRAIARDITQARTDEQRSKMDLPLAKMINDIKEAATERDKLTDGRVGVESYLPALITDANDLRGFYISAGAVYDDSEYATVLPPPVPGRETGGDGAALGGDGGGGESEVAPAASGTGGG